LVWNGSSWGNAITLDTSGTAENDQNTLGVAFEAQSGRAMVAYNKDLDPKVYYRIWNGTSWSAEASVAAPGTVTGEARTIFLASDYTSNRIVMAAMGANREGWVNVWDGSSWVPRCRWKPTSPALTTTTWPWPSSTTPARP